MELDPEILELLETRKRCNKLETDELHPELLRLKIERSEEMERHDRVIASFKQVETEYHGYQKQRRRRETSNGFQSSLFLTAAFQLLDQQQAALPANTLLAGTLKKVKIPIQLNLKHVVLTPGHLTYSADTNTCKKKVIRLEKKKLLCRISPRFPHAFELVHVDGSRRLWVASCIDEQQAWLRAIQNAMIDDTSNEISRYLTIQSSIRLAMSKEEYMEALVLVGLNGCALPIEWLHEQNKHSDKSCTIDQVLKDITRDTIELNSKWINGSDGAEKVIGSVAQYILDLCQTEPSIELTESDALKVVRNILYSCNRTQSGGDMYDAVLMLCDNPELVVLCPESTEAEPIQISISLIDPKTNHLETKDDSAAIWPESSLKMRRHRRVQSSSIAMKAVDQAKKQLQVKVHVSTTYKICDANPQGEGFDDWAVIDASFTQSFTYASFYGAIAEVGLVHLTTHQLL